MAKKDIDLSIFFEDKGARVNQPFEEIFKQQTNLRQAYLRNLKM